MKKIKFDNIFILLSYLFIVCCCLFYGSRLIHFYRIENPKIEKKKLLYDTIIQNKNLKNIDDSYVFTGKTNNNYLNYSGRLFRIVSINSDGYAKLITEDNQTSLVWGFNQEYEYSYVRKWLNNDDNEYKSFLQSLHNKDGLLVSNNTYIDIYEDNNPTNRDVIRDMAGLLSVYEYEQAGGKDSYLNNGHSFWTSTIEDEHNIYYVYKTGALIKDNFQMIGVRPTITINTKIENFEGTGSLKDPFKLIFNQGPLLKDKYVGEYIKLGNDTYRIIETDESYIKVASDLKNKMAYGKSSYFETDEGMGKFLNKELYNSLDYKDNIYIGFFNTGKYDETNYYNFNNQAAYKEKANIGLLSIGDLFLEDYEDYFLMSRPLTTKKEIYEVKKDGLITNTDISSDSNIRYTFHMHGDENVESGTGTIDDPYIVR